MAVFAAHGAALQENDVTHARAVGGTKTLHRVDIAKDRSAFLFLIDVIFILCSFSHVLFGFSNNTFLLYQQTIYMSTFINFSSTLVEYHSFSP